MDILCWKKLVERSLCGIFDESLQTKFVDSSAEEHQLAVDVGR